MRAMGWRDGNGESLLAGIPECVCWTCVWWLGEWIGQNVGWLDADADIADQVDVVVMLELVSISSVLLDIRLWMLIISSDTPFCSTCILRL